MNGGPVDERVCSEIFLRSRIWSEFAVLVSRATTVGEDREWLASLLVVVVLFGYIGETEDVRTSLWVAVDDERVTEKKFT